MAVDRVYTQNGKKQFGFWRSLTILFCLPWLNIPGRIILYQMNSPSFSIRINKLTESCMHCLQLSFCAGYWIYCPRLVFSLKFYSCYILWLRGKMSISSDEVNFLIFRYLSENGEHHAHANNEPMKLTAAHYTSRSHNYRIFPLCFHLRSRIAGGEIQHRSNGNPARRIDHIFAKGFGIHCHWRAH